MENQIDSLETLVKHIENTNEFFNISNKAGKRVMVAYDVLARIKIGNFEINKGNTINLYGKEIDRTPDRDFKDFINTNINCSVCAKGALFCGFVGRVNNYKLHNNFACEKHSNFHKKLQELFTIKQLDLIETAFEGTSYLNVISNDEIERCTKFHVSYDGSEERLIGICENLINNKGTFIV